MYDNKKIKRIRDMKIFGKNALELLSSNMNFIIPIFQRSYSWQESDCARLFEDVIGKIKDKTAPHFIGTVCYKNTEDGVLIVDGRASRSLTKHFRKENKLAEQLSCLTVKLIRVVKFHLLGECRHPNP
jgi:hypothetical protein